MQFQATVCEHCNTFEARNGLSASESETTPDMESSASGRSDGGHGGGGHYDGWKAALNGGQMDRAGDMRNETR